MIIEKSAKTRFAVLLFFLLWFVCAERARALTVEVDTFGLQQKYEAVADTASVIMLERCERKNFTAYQWKAWQGYYSVKAHVEPIATITIRREATDPIMDDMTPFIERALSECMKQGGNFLCHIRLKRSKQELGIESMTFRAWKQFFLGSYKELEDYYKNLNDGKPVTTLDTYKVAGSTENASTNPDDPDATSR